MHTNFLIYTDTILIDISLDRGRIKPCVLKDLIFGKSRLDYRDCICHHPFATPTDSILSITAVGKILPSQRIIYTHCLFHVPLFCFQQQQPKCLIFFLKFCCKHIISLHNLTKSLEDTYFKQLTPDPNFCG